MARSSVALAPARASNGSTDVKTIRCAIYTRKSTEEGLQQEFNSLDAQREASEAFIISQKHEGWQVITDHFDDGGYTGGNMDRPALKRLLAAVEARSVDCIVVYKVDRLSRSLLDFARIIEVFDKNGVSFVAVTQQFNTTSSLGRLTLHPFVVRPVRTRDHFGAHARQDVGGAAERKMDRRPSGAWVRHRSQGRPDHRQSCRGGEGPNSLWPVHGEGINAAGPSGNPEGRPREQAVDHGRRQGQGWKTIHQGLAARDADQRSVHRNG